MSETKKQFSRLIEQEPDNHAHKLMYADWLEQNGEPQVAEYLRLWVEEKTGDFTCHCFMYDCYEFDSNHPKDNAKFGCPPHRRYWEIRSRQLALCVERSNLLLLSYVFC